MKILHLIDSLDFNGSARQIALLAPGLAERGTSVEVCCLGPETAWAASLRQTGVPVHNLGWTRWFDFGVFLQFRDTLRDISADVIHVWRLPCLRALAVVAKGLLPRVVMSGPLPAKGKLAWWDRRLLAQVGCVAVAGPSDMERCLSQGLAAPALCAVPPAVEKRGRESIFIKTTPDPFSVACVGRLEHDDGFRVAIWAFDFLRHRYADARLRLVGTGTQLSALWALTTGLESDAIVEFLGAQADVAGVLRGAEVVWVPSQANGGRQLALEAMAQGRPVVASDVPCLREIIQDGATGYLVPKGDVVQFARRTKELFDDPALRERIGAAARRYIEEQVALPEVVEKWRGLYGSLAA
jgi:glycosyltransferase involved in cell wall biosynthesis